MDNIYWKKFRRKNEDILTIFSILGPKHIPGNTRIMYRRGLSSENTVHRKKAGTSS